MRSLIDALRTNAVIALLAAGLAAQPSLTPPPRLTFWAPMDEASGSGFVNISKRPDSGVHVGNPPVVSGRVDFARHYDGLSQYSDYPDSPEVDAIGLVPNSNIPGRQFTFECWIKVDQGASLAGVRAIADKRSSGSGGLRGYALFLLDGALSCQIADGTYDNYVSSLVVQPGTWHHVAMSVDRATTYTSYLVLDGVPWGFDCSAHGASMISTSPLRIGARTVSGGGWFPGVIDEVSFYQSALPLGTISLIHAADSWGKAKSRCTLPHIVTVASNQSCAGVTARIYNDHADARTYAWSLHAVAPSSVSSTCTTNGPQGFSPATGSVVVPPGSFVDVTSSLQPPAVAGAAGCYTLICSEGGDSCWTWGHAVRSLLPLSASVPCGSTSTTQTALVAGPGRFGLGGIPVSNLGATALTFGYELRVVDPDGAADTTTIALDNLDPGTPLVGSTTIAPGATVVIPVSARFVRRDPRRDYSIVLYEDSTGTMKMLGSLPVLDAIPDRLTLETTTPASGAFDLRVVNGVPGNPVYTLFTFDVSAAPYGSFFGIDITPSDFQFQVGAAGTGIAPFLLVPDPAGRAAWSATGFPPGLSLASVSLSVDPGGTGLLVSDVARSTTW